MKKLINLFFLIMLFQSAIYAQSNFNNQINVYFLTGVNRSGINNNSAIINDAKILNLLNEYNISVTNVTPSFPKFNVIDTFNAELGESSKQMDLSKIFTITLTDSTLKTTFLNSLSNMSNVLFAESNATASTNFSPNDTYYNQQWGFKNTINPNADIHAEGAWDIFKGNPNSIIAIIDGGVDISHEDLSSKIDGGDVGFITETYSNIIQFSHGTHVAGIAGAITNNNLGVSGVDWYAKIHPKECIGSNYNETDVYNAIVNSINYSPNVWTLNNSWGFLNGAYSITVRAAFAYAYKNNRLSCVAMGNSHKGLPSDNDIIGYPAGYKTGLITVGATDISDNSSQFSTRGYNIDVAAPGEGIYSTNLNNSYVYLNGTSMATPFVSGLASLLKGFNTNLNNDDIIHIIELTADDVNSTTNPGWDNQIGYGRINAQKALQAIQAPNSLQQLSTTGGTIFNTSSTMTRAFLGVPNLADAYYLVNRIEIRKYVSFPDMCKIVDVWGRGVGTTGYREENGYCFGEGICEVVPGTLTSTGCTLRTYIYHVYSELGQDLGYYPKSAGNVTFQYTILGVLQPSIIGDNLVCTTSNSYNLLNLPIGFNVTWSVSPTNLASLSCANCSSTTVDKVSDGDVTLTASFNNLCTNTTSTISKQLHIGVPQISAKAGVIFTSNGKPVLYDFLDPKTMIPCSNYYTNSNLQYSGATSVVWKKISGPDFLYTNNLNTNIEFLLSPTGRTATYQVTATNSCGSFIKSYNFKSMSCSTPVDPCSHFTVSRNGSVYIGVRQYTLNAPCLVNTGLNENFALAERISKVLIFNNAGGIVKNISYTSNPNTQEAFIDVSNLREGTYSVEIQGLNGYKEKQILNLYSSTTDIQSAEMVATGAITDEGIDRMTVLRQKLYNNLMTINNDWLGSSTSLQTFADNNMGGSFGYCYRINDLLQNGDLKGASDLLTAWTPVTNIDNNYYQYFRYYLAFANDSTFSGDDLTAMNALANKCPLVDGDAIYAMRNLYNFVTSQSLPFDNACVSNTNMVYTQDPYIHDCTGTEIAFVSGSGTISIDGSSMGDYSISNDLTVGNGDVLTLTNMNVKIQPAVKIIVKPGGRLNIYGCHLFSCGTTMWGGIEADVSNGSFGIVNINSAKQSSFIEDALVGVRLKGDNSLIAPSINNSNLVMSVENTIFNKNYTSIRLDNTQLDLSNADYYPFNFKGNIFTSRVILTQYNGVTMNTTWPNVKDLKLSNDLTTGTIPINTTTSYTPFGIKAPYIENSLYDFNSVYSNIKYYSGDLNDIEYQYMNKPRIGIDLFNFNVAGGAAIIIGEGDLIQETNSDVMNQNGQENVDLGGDVYNPNINIFDCQNVGIRALGSSLISYNNSFQNPGVTGIETYGIDSRGNNNLLNVIAPTNDDGSNFNNAFWNMTVAINAQGDNGLKVNDCKIYCDPLIKQSAQDYCDTNTNCYGVGLYGILASANDFDGVEINENELRNIEDGIHFTALWGNYGSLNIDGNGINPTNGFETNFYNPPHGLFLTHNGIILEQAGSAYTNSGNLSCSNNYVRNGDNYYTTVNNSDIGNNFIPNTIGYNQSIGINISGWQNKDCKVRNNNIHSLGDLGIIIQNCTSASNMVNDGGNVIYENVVNGQTDQLPSSQGITVENSSNVQVRCNNIGTYSDGLIKYKNQPTASRCWGNVLFASTSSSSGLLLENSTIGKQGDEGVNGFASDNQWYNTWDISVPEYMTYCKNSDATLSPFVVRNDPSNPQYNPDGFGGSSSVSNPYLSSNGSLLFAQTTSFPDVCNLGNPLLHRGGVNTTVQKAKPDTSIYNNLQLAEALAEGQISIPTSDSVERMYNMQQQLYLSLLYDTLLLNKSSILQNFMQSHQYDGYSWINLMDWVAAQNDTSTLGWILNNWQPTNNADHNNLNYYGWVYKVETKQNITTQDSLAMVSLASACPSTDGNAVYKARNLHHQLNKKYIIFKDNCIVRLPVARKAIEPIVSNIVIYPNPSKGQINIKISNAESGNWQIKVADMLGSVILNKNVNSGNGIIGLNLNAKPGIYFIQLINSKTGKQTVQKIEIQ